MAESGRSSSMRGLRVGVASLAAASAAALVLTGVTGTRAAEPAPSVGAPASGGRMAEHSPADYADEAAALPPGLVAALDRDLGVAPAQYLAESAAAVDAVRVVDALETRGVAVESARVDGAELVVSVATDSDRAAAERAGARVEETPPDSPDLDGIRFVPALDVNGGEGYAWSSTDGTSRQCSLAVTGRNVADGRPVALTAGHCIAGMDTITGGVRQLVSTAPGTGGRFGARIGSPGAGAFGDGFDGGLIALDAPDVVAHPSVLTWGGGTGAPRSSAPLEVTGWSAAIAGAALCKSGSRTGWTCGTVRGVDRTVNVGGEPVNSIIATTCIQPGDSGGAALTGQVIVGVNSSTSSAPCGDPAYVSAFFPMVSSASRASVQSQFGSSWEPDVVTPAPVLASIAPAAGVLRGTAAGASTRSVELRVDGASAPSLTVAVSGGAFAVDLGRLAAGLSPGSHRVTATAVSGTRSRSTAVETTVLVGGPPAQLAGALLPADFVER